MGRRPIGAYSPPNTLEENANQLRNLQKGLERIGELREATTSGETIELVNAILLGIRQLTDGK